VVHTQKLVRSRYNLHRSCTTDLSFRNEMLEACLGVESRAAPSSFWVDVFVETVPKLSVFVFFDAADVFTPWVLARILGIAAVKMLLGEVVGGAWKYVFAAK